MTKHYCDKCGKKITPLIGWDITIESRNTDTYFRYELCSECTIELRRQLSENKEEEE